MAKPFKTSRAVMARLSAAQKANLVETSAGPALKTKPARKDAPARLIPVSELLAAKKAKPKGQIAADIAAAAQARRRNIDREGPIHRAILHYLQLALPRAIIHHSPNAIAKSGEDIARMIVKNRSNGTVKGFPDLIVLPWASMGPMLFEVKPEGEHPDADQAALHERLRDLGYRVAVVRSVEDVKAALGEWGVWDHTQVRRMV